MTKLTWGAAGGVTTAALLAAWGGVTMTSLHAEPRGSSAWSTSETARAEEARELAWAEVRDVALITLQALPDEASCREHPDPAVRRFLTETRALLEDAVNNESWDWYRAREFSASLSWLALGVEVGLGVGAGGEGLSIGGLGLPTPDKGTRSCTKQCVNERRDCILEECGPGIHEWPCTCCVPCNVTWLVCLADCLIGP